MPKIFICYARIRKNNCRAKTNRGMAAVTVGGSLRSAVSVGLGPVAIRVAPFMRHVGVWLPCHGRAVCRARLPWHGLLRVGLAL